MKLRNKKTGEIGYLIVGRGSDYYTVCNDEWDDCGKYGSLAELNDDWEDYEEPKAYYIGRCGTIEEFDPTKDVGLTEMLKEIGNYFETEEETEKAVEKIKAWQRLKDKITAIDRASFDGVGTATLFVRYKSKDHEEVQGLLALLFGGEE